jgi:hypothetical protein
MKTIIYFILFAFLFLFGCDDKPINDEDEVSYMQNIDKQISEIDTELAKAEEYYKKLSSGSITLVHPQHPVMLTDVANAHSSVARLKAAKANLEFLKANLESSYRLIQSIEQFDESSAKLSNKMLWLTRMIAFLTLVMLLIALIQIKDTSTVQWLFHKMSSPKNIEPEIEATTNEIKGSQQDSEQQSKLSVVEEESEEPELPAEGEATIN